MVLQRSRNHGFIEKAMSAASTGLKHAATDKAIYDVGRQVYNVARVAAPFVAALLYTWFYYKCTSAALISRPSGLVDMPKRLLTGRKTR